jgi:hypothetical protein
MDGPVCQETIHKSFPVGSWKKPEGFDPHKSSQTWPHCSGIF